jgi:ribonucleoside-diphosphate reductase beta chain
LTAEEIDLSQDLNDWNNKLSDEERYFVKHILAFFCCFGWDCKRKFGREFCKRGTICRGKVFYGFQIMMENIHSETYSLLIDTYVKDEAEKDELFNALEVFLLLRKKQTGL